MYRGNSRYNCQGREISPLRKQPSELIPPRNKPPSTTTKNN